VAVLTARGDRTEIVLQATSGISRANHVHSGSCENLGGVVHGLTNMADGISVTTISVPLNSLLTGGFAINLHHVDTASIWTACGDLPASDAFVTIALEEENESGQTGVATLMARGNVTDVALVATHGISRANHIHTGNCGPTLGGVTHGLTNMAEGLSITTVDATLSSLRTGGFAINLHNAQTASIYTACGDIPAAGVATTGAGSPTPTPAPTPTPTPPVLMDDYDYY
jgi:hypothetical protein